MLRTVKEGGLARKVTDHDSSVRALASEIMAYLEANPNATDTLDGVTNWWLGPRVARYAKEEVQKALDSLVNEGKVSRKVVAGGDTVYSSGERWNPAK